jgi:hypothetical protein
MPERAVLLAIALAIPGVACSQDAARSTESPAQDQSSEPAIEKVSGATTASPSAPPPVEESSEVDVEQPEARATPMGCWERTFGAPPAPEALDPSLAQTIPDCPDCPSLHAGPLAAGLHPEVLRRLHAISQKLPEPPIPEPVMWVNSGARDGPPSKSMHNQALAVDLVICGLNSPQTAGHLREAGFTCVIEYYDGDGRPCNVAHADLRGTKWAKGAYAPGGWKSKSCPGRAVSKGEDCQNQRKEDWSYSRD